MESIREIPGRQAGAVAWVGGVLGGGYMGWSWGSLSSSGLIQRMEDMYQENQLDPDRTSCFCERLLSRGCGEKAVLQIFAFLLLSPPFQVSLCFSSLFHHSTWKPSLKTFSLAWEIAGCAFSSSLFALLFVPLHLAFPPSHLPGS